MEPIAWDQCVLAARGYKCEVTFRRSYRGSIFLSQIVTADLGNRRGFVFMPPDQRIPHFLRIRSIQARVPMAAQIIDVIDNRVFVSERAPGVLLWEIEHDLPPTTEIQMALGSFITTLRSVGLVHADIRPWNIFFDSAQHGFKVIDWGFSFFLGNDLDEKTRGHLSGRGYASTPVAEIDAMDAQKTVQVLAGQISYEEAWHHQPNEMEWRPAWTKRFPYQ